MMILLYSVALILAANGVSCVWRVWHRARSGRPSCADALLPLAAVLFAAAYGLIAWA